MRRFASVCAAFFAWSAGIAAQVGIGTANVHQSALLQLESTKAAFVLPRMSDTQMTAVPNPEIGSMVFNTSENLPYFRSSAGWSGFDLNSNPTVILSRSGGNLTTSTTNTYSMQLSSANTVSISSAYFNVDGPGAITVNRAGVYLFSASMAVSNMPVGSRNYHLGIYRSGALVGYLSRSRLENTSVDYWGMTGTLMYYAEAGDQFTFRYFIHHTASLSNVIQTICITKLN
ncbi:hypothetical protein [Flavobacterium selenitireducens]|uniref:hypothetical protein n=1 Tax=Flavobacterium selenitireducens TaxID=2722704 RepID=UPI00168C040D|nr:hypothetical protein [Flavobacterium selenitireducens]MBD3582547.1 hypothetical protein [Flavobacterium selenitireducens]